MTILIYDHLDLDERASRHLNAWKVWHLVMYALAAIFGIVNYVFLQETMQLVDDNCILFPRELAFHDVELPDLAKTDDDYDGNVTMNENFSEVPSSKNAKDTIPKDVTDSGSETNNDAQNKNVLSENRNDDKAKIIKRDAHDNENTKPTENSTMDGNVTLNTGKTIHRQMLDIQRTLFETDNGCQFAEYMPVMSTVFAAVWLTMFTMCPAGGRTRSGLQQPWRILAPALIFSLVMVGLTGHSFTLTNGGLHAFCAAFSEVTNATTCSSVNPYLERGWNATWGLGGRAAATRAVSAGVWASWACAAALLLARCLAAPDFAVKRTAVCLVRDPKQKITPHLKKSHSYRSSRSSPSKRDNVSMRSEPTVTTELPVTVSVHDVHEQDSAQSSLMVTPAKTNGNSDNTAITLTPQERHLKLQ